MYLANYKIGDEIEILRLFEKVFSRKLSLENWLWRFRDNPFGKHFIKLMWDNENLVGHYAVSPLKMLVGEEEVMTALSLTTMTHPDYQGRGIFGKLSLELYKELEQEHNCKAVWGFPNNNSHYGFIKKLGWENLSIIHTLALDLKLLTTKGTEFTCNRIIQFNESHATYIKEKFHFSGSVFIKYSVEFLNWRFIRKPNTTYRCYEFNAESGKSILIVKPYYKTDTKKYILNIISCFMDSYNEIHEYISYILKDFDLDFEKVTIWKSLWDPNHLELEKQRFVPELPQTYLGARIHASMPSAFSDFRNWNISMSDSDVF